MELFTYNRNVNNHIRTIQKPVSKDTYIKLYWKITLILCVIFYGNNLIWRGTYEQEEN
jgi:hypothetical protein